MCVVVQLLVGVKQQSLCSNVEGGDYAQSTFSQSDDIFWSNSDNLRAIEDIERAIAERDEFKDVLSFSLGLTQDFNGGADMGCVRSDHMDLAGVQGNVDVAVDVGVDKVPASPGLLATDRFEPGSGIVVSADAPEFVTPHEDLVGDHEGSAYIPSDGTACGAPLKSDRAIIPPYSSVSLLSSFDNMSNEPVGSSMAPLPDLPEDVVVVNWLLGGAGADMEVTVFSIDGREARWDDLLTLVPRSEIGAAVIDAWACLLNLREILRDSAVPTRFFASTFTTVTCCYCISFWFSSLCSWCFS
nr:uncharacterized protein LOC109189836 [Ipomoea batatas]